MDEDGERRVRDLGERHGDEDTLMACGAVKAVLRSPRFPKGACPRPGQAVGFVETVTGDVLALGAESE